MEKILLQIDRIMNEFLRDNDFDDCTCGLDTDFAYYYDKNYITYALVVSERMDKLFLNFAMRNGLAYNCGTFLLSFFHELGHYETIDEINDIDYTYAQDVKATLTNSDKDCEIYFNLPDEIAATEWAINYINNHYNIIEKLANQLIPIVQSLEVT